MELDPPLTRIRWKNTCRLIPSRYPSVGILDRVASANDLRQKGETSVCKPVFSQHHVKRDLFAVMSEFTPRSLLPSVTRVRNPNPKP